MRVLLVTAFFPPYAPKAATRAPALARHLLDQGHDVRVLGARNTLVDAVLSHRIPEDLISQAAVIEPREISPRDHAPADSTALSTRLFGALIAALELPDRRAGWIPFAIESGSRLCRDWKPDIIFTSVPPHAGLFVAASLARRLGVPWVVDFRDLWVDHPYYEAPAMRRMIDRILQNRVLSTVCGFVTVTEGWARLLGQKYDRPVACVLNGYDPGDFVEPIATPGKTGEMSLIYGGGIYSGKRDPRPLFEAISLLGWGPTEIMVRFHVDNQATVRDWARRSGVEAMVDVQGLVQRDVLLRRQRESDVLLLLRWDDPSEDHVVAGKLFEYIGCRRPILSVGRESGEAARIILDNGLGAVASDPRKIAELLRRWSEMKRESGIPSPTDTIPEAFSRNYQFRVLERFLQDVVAGTARAR